MTGDEQRFRITKLDETDSNEVYDWCFHRCRMLDLEFLAEDLRTTRDRERVAAAMVSRFPTAAREAALRGCRDGFVAQDEAGGPMPRPPKPPLG